MARKQFVSDIEPGDSVRSHFAVAKKSLRQFRNKDGSFLSLVLADKTGSVTANVWDNAEEVGAAFDEGDIVLVDAKAEQYQGRNQLKLQSVEWADASEVDLTDFLPRSDVDPAVVQKRIEDAITGIGSDPLRELLRSVFGDKELLPRFLESPAAKGLHHARIGGLAEHVASALDIAEAVCKAHPSLDHDIVVAGVLLHDIGKLWELECRAAISYSAAGRLLGHISIGFSEVDRRARGIPGFPEDLRLQLLHIILSHHGEAQFGSPIRPMTAEAIAVHSIENCDAQVSQFAEKIAVAVEEGRQFTQYDTLLERYLYAGGAQPQDRGRPQQEGGGGGTQTQLF
jgi:3'-5' exoribonuclease